MDTDLGILNLIRQKKDRLSRGHKKIAEYILEYYEKAAFLTAAELGERTGVSESTVVRFPTVLGLHGYGSLQKELAQVVCEKLHVTERIDIDHTKLNQEEVLTSVMLSDAKKIEYTLKELDRKAFQMAVEDILKAEKVYIIGIRNCAPLATYFYGFLKVIRENVIQIQSTNTSELFEQMMYVTNRDTVIGISFPRYSMRTLKAMEFANNRNARVIAITDNRHSPMNMYSSCNLFARSDMSSIADSIAAPISLMNALLVSLSVRRKEQVLNNLKMLEDMMTDYSFENCDEINLADDRLDIESIHMAGETVLL